MIRLFIKDMEGKTNLQIWLILISAFKVSNFINYELSIGL